MPSKIGGLLAKFGASPHRLCLEIAENSLAGLRENKLAVLRSIQELGIKLVIKEFGAGQCSIKLLATLEFYRMKLDTSLIHATWNNPKGISILSSIISMGAHLGVGIVGDGVETEEQSQLLKRLDCTEAQGPFFYGPMSGPGFVAQFGDRMTLAEWPQAVGQTSDLDAH
ncbi:EAL domain-containing protein [Acidiphilium acidophilum]|uniref:EAL domain-containing protein n=1 Tax=Acidiphilium acidophilum TaxID=76588 RepID=UPI002E8E6FC0|nr:EAL domain-containing protein [Acidiphilium acidophilum]